MSVVTYKCPNCDGELKFDPESQQFACEYCLSSFTEAQVKELAPAAETERTADPAGEQTDSGAVYYSCPSCGAEIVTDETTAATYCFYCHNPVVLSGRLDGAYTPQKLIPFAFGKEEAQKRFLAWTKKKWFVPKAFFNADQIEKLTGVYFPHWLVDCDIQAHMEASAKKVRVWRSGDTEYTETSRYNLVRTANIHFEDVVKTALKKADRELVESVQPYDSRNLIPFTMAYLSGFQAEKRDIERADLEQEVANDIQGYSASLLQGTMSGYSAVVPRVRNVRLLKENWDYTLLPVWTLTYRGKNGKLYYYALNGQNGNVFGRLPVSFGKLFAVAGAISAAVLILGLLGGLML